MKTVRAPRRDDEVAAPAPPTSALEPPDEGVLGDIAHEMGNHLHKLYYWTDYLREQVGGRGEAEAAAVEMLGAAVGRLDRFMRMILEFFAPARICFTKVKAAELVGGLQNYLPGRRLVVEGLDEVADVEVYADAGLLGHAIRTVFERVAATLVEEDELRVGIMATTRRQYRGLEIAFQAGAGQTGGLLRPGIELSVAEKFLHMHGAELAECEGPPRTLVVFLPLYS